MNTVCCPVRKAFLLYVDLDPFPGTFHTQYSAYLNVQGLLENAIPAYNPNVILSSAHPKKNEANGRDRICFLVLVDLDPIPGSFHSQESAQHWLGLIFQRNIAHYNPMISLGPDFIQPNDILKGTIEV